MALGGPPQVVSSRVGGRVSCRTACCAAVLLCCSPESCGRRGAGVHGVRGRVRRLVLHVAVHAALGRRSPCQKPRGV